MMALLRPMRVQHVYSYRALVYDIQPLHLFRLARAVGVKGVTFDTFIDKVRCLLCTRLARQGRLQHRANQKTALPVTKLFNLDTEELRKLCRQLGFADR